MELVWLKNWILNFINLNLNSYRWLLDAILDSSILGNGQHWDLCSISGKSTKQRTMLGSNYPCGIEYRSKSKHDCEASSEDTLKSLFHSLTHSTFHLGILCLIFYWVFKVYLFTWALHGHFVTWVTNIFLNNFYLFTFFTVSFTMDVF